MKPHKSMELCCLLPFLFIYLLFSSHSHPPNYISFSYITNVTLLQSDSDIELQVVKIEKTEELKKERQHRGMSTEIEKESLITEAHNAPITTQRRIRDDFGKLSSKAMLHAVGFNIIAYVITALGINLAMSYPTQSSWFPSLLFPIYIHNIRRIKHGSDSGIYDTKGRYVPANLEHMFSKYARTVHDKLTLGELWDMIEGNRNAFDPYGWTAFKLEWGYLYILARDGEGFLSKEAVRHCYDVSLFEYCVKKKAGKLG